MRLGGLRDTPFPLGLLGGDLATRQEGIEGRIQHTAAIGQLRHEEIGREIRLDDESAALDRGHVPADQRHLAQSGRGLQGEADDLAPVRHLDADQGGPSVGMMRHLLEAETAAAHHAYDPRRLEVEGRQQIARAPEVVGDVVAGGDLPQRPEELWPLVGEDRDRAYSGEAVAGDRAHVGVGRNAALEDVAAPVVLGHGGREVVDGDLAVRPGNEAVRAAIVGFQANRAQAALRIHRLAEQRIVARAAQEVRQSRGLAQDRDAAHAEGVGIERQRRDDGEPVAAEQRGDGELVAHHPPPFAVVVGGHPDAAFRIQPNERGDVGAGEPGVVEQAQADELVVGEPARTERRLGEVQQKPLISLAIFGRDGAQGGGQVEAGLDDIGLEDDLFRLALGNGVGRAAKR